MMIRIQAKERPLLYQFTRRNEKEREGARYREESVPELAES